MKTKESKLKAVKEVYPDAEWEVRNGRKTSYVNFVDRHGYKNLIHIDDLLMAMIERGELEGGN